MMITEENKKRYFIVLIALCVIVITAAGLTSCVGSSANDRTENKAQNVAEDAGKVIAEDKSDITIVDQAGRSVKVGKYPGSIALCYRVAIRFLLSLNQGDKITGIGKNEEFLEELQPSLADCMDVGKGVADIEALAELKPDLFIHKASDPETLDAVENIGIPAIGINVETPEQMIKAIDILGKVCGVEEKANRLIEYYESGIEALGNRTKDLEEGDMPRALVMGSSIGKVADGSMLQGTMLEMAGGINCAGNLKATELWPTAGVEQIFSWNPQYIFITGSESAVYTADDLLNDKAWSEVEAVKDNNVYVIPAQKDSWEFPGVVSLLGIEYMMNIMHPDLLSGEELEEDVNDFYQLSYGKKFEREYLGY